jgi:nucleotide-binding universal stress UspA family protein
MSDPVTQILLATDFSDSSAPAAEVAAAYARSLGGRLHVVHVTHPGWKAEMLEALRAYVQRFPDIAVIAAVETGFPAERIVEYAHRNGVQLIVLGTHGRSGFTRAVLGSVAERVTRTAHCPVMTVPRDVDGVTLHAPGPSAGALTIAEPAAPRRCLVCHSVSEEAICEPCRARIRAEALQHKLQEEKVRV